MDSNDCQEESFHVPVPPEGTRVINDRCVVRTQDRHRVIVASGIVLSHYTLGDRMAEAHAMVALVEQGWADQNDVALAFGYSVRTVRRYQRRFEDGGLSALGNGSGYPRGCRRVRASRTKLIQRLKAQGHSAREIARRIGISDRAVRKLLRRQRPRTPPYEQTSLPVGNTEGANPNLSAFSAPADAAPSASAPLRSDQNLSAIPSPEEEALPLSLDSDPANRCLDRMLACVGLLDDAAPLFRPGTRVPAAGVLLALPALVQSGVFECARTTYHRLGPAFYGLRTTILALLLMALVRSKRPEGLKERPPDDFGRLLGLDRAPEIKTLRRKLMRLAAFGRATQFGHALAERRVALRGSALGFLYVDGHVRVYHSAPCPRRTWHACACPCLPRQITGSTTWRETLYSSSRQKPMPGS